MNSLPFSVDIPYQDPAVLFHVFSNQPWALLLDSADSNRSFEDTNRYSYIAFDPFETIVIKDKKRVENDEMIDHPFQYLKTIMSPYQLETRVDLPLFQGGAAGYFSYDLCHYLENIPKPIHKEHTSFADLAIGLYDTVISFDHHQQKAWIVATGFPEITRATQLRRAKDRVSRCVAMIASIGHSNVSALQNHRYEINSSFDEQSYGALVQKAQDYILEGDIFQVNLSHRFEASMSDASINRYDLYLNMRAHNPSPFSAYFNLGDHQILSTSPERFLSCQEGRVSTRPIKGTTSRGRTVEDDQQRKDALLISDKDRAENIMIVDLLRNDLSKVCTVDSVGVKKLCGIETYPTVHHLVSVVEGFLQPGSTALDLLEACFPGGSITGAPKVRAMEIIYELEPTARGPYCGSLAYLGFNGTMDSSIIIRTVLLDDHTISYQVGGAIVLDSSPEGEYKETLIKSASIRSVLFGLGRDAPSGVAE